MVFFNCNACGEALKKSAVEKHYLTKCRQCEVLSCVDCGKDFWGDEYQKHVKCITEEEKYSGKNFKPRPNANKGEKKQELWIQQVQEAVQKASGNASLRTILQKLVDYPNIPRKQAKFENFLKNSMGVYNQNLCSRVWETMSSYMNKPEAKIPNKEQPSNAGGSDEITHNKIKDDNDHKNDDKNRRVTEDQNSRGSDSGSGMKTKKNKRKHDELQNGVAADVETKPKKSKKDASKEDENSVSQNGHVISVAETPGPIKFRLECSIASVLEKREGKDISMKKLRKKVLNEYRTLVAEDDRLPLEKFLAKFDRKIARNERFKVHEDRVTLLK